MTSRQRPQTFRELVADLYVQAVAPGRLHDPQADLPARVEVDEPWLSIGDEKHPVAVALGPGGEWLDLRLSGPGFDWGGWFTDLAARGVLGDDRRRPRLRAGPGCVGTGPAAVRRAHAAHRGLPHPRPGPGCPDPPGLGYPSCKDWRGNDRWRPARVCCPYSRWMRLDPEVPASNKRLEGWLERFQPRVRLTRGLKTEAGVRHFVGLMARGMVCNGIGNHPFVRRVPHDGLPPISTR